jgi:hypothetical protein
MPDDAKPQPWPAPVELDGAHCLRRIYRDPLGRPMTGHVKITGQTRHEDGTTVIPPVSVKADVADGRLDVHLPPDTYKLVASLTTVDGHSYVDTATAVVD